MPGPPDLTGQQLRVAAADRGYGADVPAAGDRAARGSVADLLRRLDGLPHGHPSSPYHGDGTPKPALTRLKDLELPLPAAGARQGPPRGGGAVAEEAAQDELIPDPAAVEGDDGPGDDGPGDAPELLPGEQLTPDQVRIAVRAHGRCRLAEGRSVFGSYGEGGLTPAMRRIEEHLEHGELVPETEKYALKSLDRFQQKLAKLIAEEPGASPDGLAAQIHDGIRYTFLYEPDVYTRGVQATRSTLDAHGYELQVLRNGWESGESKGISSHWRDPVSGCHFEIQFRTRESWDARRQAHDALPLAERTGELR